MVCRTSFAVQNVKLKGSSLTLHKLSIDFQKKLALFLLTFIIKKFKDEEKAPTAQELANTSALPVHTTEFILNNMAKAGILSEVLLDEEKGYQPASHIENLTISKVINKYETFGKDDSKYIKNKIYKEIEERLKKIKEFQAQSGTDFPVKDIII